MGQEIVVKIEVDESECSECCPFLDDSLCRLFNIEVEDTKLPNGYVWNNTEPTKHRCTFCLGLID